MWTQNDNERYRLGVCYFWLRSLLLVSKSVYCAAKACIVHEHIFFSPPLFLLFCLFYRCTTFRASQGVICVCGEEGNTTPLKTNTCRRLPRLGPLSVSPLIGECKLRLHCFISDIATGIFQCFICDFQMWLPYKTRLNAYTSLFPCFFSSFYFKVSWGCDGKVAEMETEEDGRRFYYSYSIKGKKTKVYCQYDSRKGLEDAIMERRTLVWNRVQILTILVWNRVRFAHSDMGSGMVLTRSYFFSLIFFSKELRFD